MTVRWGFLGAGTMARVLAQAVHEADGGRPVPVAP